MTTYTTGPLPFGVHQIPDQAYHMDPAERPSLSSTLARTLLNQSPLHAWWAHPRLNPEWLPKESKAFDIGRAAHRKVLGAGAGYVEIDVDLLSADGGVRSKEARAFVQAARESGLTPLKGYEIEDIERMHEVLSEKLGALDISFDPAHSEVAALAEIDGVICRAMIDSAPADPNASLFDFKTTADASPEHCTRAVMNYGYDVQAAHYLETWRAATGETRTFTFVFQEKEAPFEVCLVRLGEDTLTMAQKKTARARDIWRQCVESGHWPGYPAGVHQVELPDWFHERWLDRETAEADFRANYGRDILDAAGRWQAPEGWAAE